MVIDPGIGMKVTCKKEISMKINGAHAPVELI